MFCANISFLVSAEISVSKIRSSCVVADSVRSHRDSDSVTTRVRLRVLPARPAIILSLYYSLTKLCLPSSHTLRAALTSSRQV